MKTRSPRKLSFSTLGTPGWSVDRVIELAQRFGWGGIDLRLADEGGGLSPRTPLAEVRALGRRPSDAGLEAPSL